MLVAISFGWFILAPVWAALDGFPSSAAAFSDASLIGLIHWASCAIAACAAAIPQAWLAKLAMGDEILALADRLLAERHGVSSTLAQ